MKLAWTKRNVFGGQKMPNKSTGTIIALLLLLGGNTTLAHARACQNQSPTVTLSPSPQKSFPGKSVSYTVEVKNNDGSECVDSTFNLSSMIPAGLTKCLSQLSLTLTPGDTGLATLTVSSAISTIPGSYTVSVTATNSSSAFHTGMGTGTYVVEVNPFQIAVSSDKKTYLRSSMPYYANLTARATFNGEALSYFSIAGTLTWPDGQTQSIPVKTNSTGTRWFGQDIQMSSQVGTYQFSVTATYQGMTVTRSTAFVVQ